MAALGESMGRFVYFEVALSPGRGIPPDLAQLLSWVIGLCGVGLCVVWARGGEDQLAGLVQGVEWRQQDGAVAIVQDPGSSCLCRSGGMFTQRCLMVQQEERELRRAHKLIRASA